MANCMTCGVPLSRDEIGLHRKIVNRGATQYCCIHCLAKHFKVSEAELRDMIERFREAGCTLFR